MGGWIKKMKTKVKEILKNIKLTKMKLYLSAGVVSILLVSSFVYALGSEDRAIMKAIEEKKKQELQLEMDKAAALVAEAKVKQEMIDKSEKAKDIIISKGEYSPITIETEREPEIASENNGALSKWWSKNILRIHIPYVIKYVIDMEKVVPLVTEDGLYVEFGEDDFEVVVIPGTYTIMTPDSNEVGMFPKEFKNQDVLALVSSNAKMVAEEYAKNRENINEAVEETKKMISGIIESCGAKVTFTEKRTVTGAKSSIDTEGMDN